MGSGVRQAYSILTAIEPETGIELLCSAYPNPASDFFYA